MQATQEFMDLIEPYNHVDFGDDESSNISAARLLVELHAVAVIDARKRVSKSGGWKNQFPLEFITCEGETVRAMREGRTPDFSKFTDSTSADGGAQERLRGLRNIKCFRVPEHKERQLRAMQPQQAVDALVEYVATESFFY